MSRSKTYQHFARLGIVCVAMIVWELSVVSGFINPFIVASISQIIDGGFRLLILGEGITTQQLRATGGAISAGGIGSIEVPFSHHFVVTSFSIAIAYSLAIVTGLGAGLILGIRKYLWNFFDPIIMGLFSIPKITLYPLFIIFLGIGIESKIWFGAFHGFFPIIIFTVAGVKNIQPAMLTYAKAMGASQIDMYSRVILPAIVPSLIAGMRLGLILTVPSVLVGEMIGSKAGIGWMMIQLAELFLAPKLYATVLIVATITITANYLMLVVEKRVSKWRL